MHLIYYVTWLDSSQICHDLNNDFLRIYERTKLQNYYSVLENSTTVNICNVIKPCPTATFEIIIYYSNPSVLLSWYTISTSLFECHNKHATHSVYLVNLSEFNLLVRKSLLFISYLYLFYYSLSCQCHTLFSFSFFHLVTLSI